MNRSRLFCSFPMTCECGSWKASVRFGARIGTMNHPVTPSHSLNGGEGGRRPGDGAVHGEPGPPILDAHGGHEPNRSRARPRPGNQKDESRTRTTRREVHGERTHVISGRLVSRPVY